MRDEPGTTEGSTARREIPRIISVDDHVLEPPDLWVDRVSRKFRDRAPRVVRERGRQVAEAHREWVPDEDGVLADVWYYEDVVVPLKLPSAGVDRDRDGFNPVTFDDIRPGCFEQKWRLVDMDEGHTEAAACFPNVPTRFCGQLFMGGADTDLALECVRAYNDWMIDDWCGGEGAGRLIPITLVPLWDAHLAAAEVARCAAKGSHAVAFTEMPGNLGLPTWYSGGWDPLLAACEANETTLCMHIGSSGLATTSADAPFGAMATITFQYGMHSLIDTIISGTYERFPGLKMMYSEANVGWMAYVLDRLDHVWKQQGSKLSGIELTREPSSYVPGHVYGCIVDDIVGLANRDRVGMDQICYEVDYPHSASLWPDCEQVARDLCDAAGLSDEETYKFVRGNAIAAFGLERFGITR